jgi:hypothetical protein
MDTEHILDQALNRISKLEDVLMGTNGEGIKTKVSLMERAMEELLKTISTINTQVASTCLTVTNQCKTSMRVTLAICALLVTIFTSFNVLIYKVVIDDIKSRPAIIQIVPGVK